MRVRVVNQNREDIVYGDLTLGNTYRVLGIEADDLRIISDEGRPYLYPMDLFEIVDSTESADWTTTFGEDGERYSYPPELGAVGFFEDYFDDVREAVMTFRMYVATAFRGG